MIKGCQKLGISNTGRTWVEIAVDPFKDLPIPPEGYPDQIMAPSCVQIVRQQQSIITSNGTNTWDCNIFMDTCPVQVALVNTVSLGNTFAKADQSGVSIYRGGVVVRKGIAGSDLKNVSASAPSLGLPMDYFDNTDTRVVAQGFEVRNVTNALNVNGAVTVWRNPRFKDQGYKTSTIVDTIDGSTACIPNACDWLDLPEPPETGSEAILLPGSRTWKASEGCYVVPVMAKSENPPSELNILNITATDDDGTLFAPPYTKTGANNLMRYPLILNVETPFNMQGAYFEGLSPETVLQLNVIYIVERFADDVNSDLATLSRPSSTYDAEALKLYSKITREMPPGVPVSENGFGDWISGIAGVISKVAKAASFIPGPLGLIAGGVGAISGMVEEGFNENPVQVVETTKPRIIQAQAPVLVQTSQPQQAASFTVVQPKKVKTKKRKGPVLVQGSNVQPQSFTIVQPKRQTRSFAKGPRLVQAQQPLQYEIVQPTRNRRNNNYQLNADFQPNTNSSTRYNSWNSRQRY